GGATGESVVFRFAAPTVCGAACVVGVPLPAGTRLDGSGAGATAGAVPGTPAGTPAGATGATGLLPSILPVAYTMPSLTFAKVSVGIGYAFGSGFASRGVTMNTSSVLSSWKFVLRNSAPSTGTSPMPGSALIVPVALLFIRPPIAKLWPS